MFLYYIVFMMLILNQNQIILSHLYIFILYWFYDITIRPKSDYFRLFTCLYIVLLYDITIRLKLNYFKSFKCLYIVLLLLYHF